MALLAWGLTRLITHVDHQAYASVSIRFDERPPFTADPNRFDLPTAQRARFRIPAVMFADLHQMVLVVTPATRSVTIDAVDPRAISCGYLDRAIGATSRVRLAEVVLRAPVIALDAPATGGKRIALTVPPTLHAALLRTPNTVGAIRCAVMRSVAAEPTYTERAVTLEASNPPGGLVFADVSALEGIDNLRFSGGIYVPFAGERARLLGPADDIVSVEWTSVDAQERRDVILVTLGALAAMAAATAIEAIRPFIEK